MRRVYINATKHGNPIFLVTGMGKLRIPNWHRMEVRRRRDNDEFGWGDCGRKSRATAYSILRATVGRETAAQLQDIFLQEYVSQLKPDRGFRLSLNRLLHIAGDMSARS